MFTGRYPHEGGVYNNISKRAPEIKSWTWLAKLLKEHGYDTGLAGKWHLILDPESTKEIHGFDFVPLGKMYTDFLVKDVSEDFLKQERENPFFLVASYIDPHDICGWARGDNLYNGEIGRPPEDESELPPLPKGFEIPEDEAEVLIETRKRFPSHHPTLDWDEKKWRQYLWANYRLIEVVDKRIGKVLDILEETGEWDNTIIMFVSDHGEGMARHHWNQKQALLDTVTRIPFMIGKKGWKRGGMVDDSHLVSTGIDIMATICDYADISPPKDNMGVSVRPAINPNGFEGDIDQASINTREYVISESELTAFQDEAGTHINPSGRMVRSARYKYCVYSEGENRKQLFDMKEDPEETKNLINEPDMEEIIARHEKYLDEWIEKTEDDFREEEKKQYWTGDTGYGDT